MPRASWWKLIALVVLLAGSGVMPGLPGASAWAADEVDLPEPTSATEPIAGKVSYERAGAFLDAVALDWTRTRKCGTCHTNYAYLMTQPALGIANSPAATEIRTFFENRIAHWDDPEKGSKPRWDAEVVATGSVLAIHDAATSGTLHPLTRKALDRMWTLQKPDGSWTWLKCNWPPLEDDDYYGAVFAALGVGHAPGGYAQSSTAQAGLEKLRGYLRSTPAPNLHHKVILLWASTRLDGLMEPAERDTTMAQLGALQQKDGGWSLPSLGDWKRRDGSANAKDAASDGYATGLAVYVLRRAGVPVSDPAIQRGVAWLKQNQRESGRWFTRSVNNDKAHYITNAGTGFAVLALKACEE